VGTVAKKGAVKKSKRIICKRGGKNKSFRRGTKRKINHKRNQFLPSYWRHGSLFRVLAGKDTTPRITAMYGGADKSLARPTSQCILFDHENISFDASLVTYINSTNIPAIMIINRI